MDDVLQRILEKIPDPSKGLPDEVFRFALKIVPMVNVDLLVRNEKGEHLLAWREDEYGHGWHIPGGILRHNETMERRIAAVAEDELTAAVQCKPPRPVNVMETFHGRGHFISLLFLCALATPVRDAALWHRGGKPRPGQIAWLKNMPDKVYETHVAYADWLCGRQPYNESPRRRSSLQAGWAPA